MNEQKLIEYAKLIVKIGANVQKGQRVRLQAEIDQLPLVKAVTEECYKAGASYVEIIWSCGETAKLHYQYATAETLGEVPHWEEERFKQMTVDLPVRIFIESADPDEMDGISADLLSTVNRMRTKVLKKYRDELDGKHQWLIVAAASLKWAKKIFPNETETDAVDKLWNAIFDCVYLKDGTDAELTLKTHTDKMTEKAQWLDEQKFVKLHYTSTNGIDFTVDLIPEAKWAGAGDTNHVNGVFYVPNMPTEEVFTSPMKGKCEGRLVSTKPLRELLREVGFDIIAEREAQNRYAIGSRLFELPELKLLIDAVESSKPVNEKIYYIVDGIHTFSVSLNHTAFSGLFHL